MALSNADIAARVTARAAVEKSAAGPGRALRERRTPRAKRPQEAKDTAGTTAA